MYHPECVMEITATSCLQDFSFVPFLHLLINVSFFLIIIIIDTVGGLDLHQPHFLMSEELQEASAGNAVHAAAPASWTPGTRWRSRICPICEELMKSHHYFIFNEKLLFSETFSGSASCLFLL